MKIFYYGLSPKQEAKMQDLFITFLEERVSDTTFYADHMKRNPPYYKDELSSIKELNNVQMISEILFNIREKEKLKEEVQEFRKLKQSLDHIKKAFNT